ncbi:gluconate 2-dehydrogenase subunit 3 family protein [Streptomyces sp. NPDC088551]|uniref:gluconate 2-dehydrogenase subunit 3 family protein n=1 Tax=Streptomyces sp. NPDC088551 TaxID=3365863 RepID=UPI00381909E5
MAWSFFDAHQAEVVREATALLIPGPADAPEETDPGAREADAVRYADRLLGAFTAEPPLVYASGRGDGSFLPLTPAQGVGWRRRVGELQEAYRTGIAALDRLAGGDFAAAPVAARHLALRDPGAEDFRGLLFDHAVEATYGDPVYRGRTAHREDPAADGPLHLGMPGPAGAPARPGPVPRTRGGAAPGDGARGPAPLRPYAGEGEDPVRRLARHFTDAARAVASGGSDG